MGKNVRIRGTAFAANLDRFRVMKKLSKPDLAHATGLSWRTIDNYSKDRFEFAQESALLRIAEVLDVSLEDLLAPCEKKRPVYKQPVFLFAVLIALAIVSALASRVFRNSDHIEIRETSVRLPAGELIFQSKIVDWIQGNWDGRDVLVIGKLGNNDEYGSVLAIDVESAELLWEHRPDKEILGRVFPAKIVGQGDFYAHSLSLTDLNGDGVKEVAAAMRHNMSYPSYLSVIDNAGHVESTYYCAGHINTVTPFDLDGDGKDEIYIAATNNTAMYEGGTLIVLDELCRNGAALDEESARGHFADLSLPDSCKVRVVFPSYPMEFTNLLETPRMDAFNLWINADQSVPDRLTLNMGQPGKSLIVPFDSDMHPFDPYPSDLLAKLNRSWVGSGQISRDYLSDEALGEWLAGHRRFTAGHWSPQ